MDTQVAFKVAPCTACNVVLCDDSVCDWCFFWEQLAVLPVSEREYVTEGMGLFNFCRRIGVDMGVR